MKHALHISKVYLLLLTVFTAAIVAVHFIPSDAIRNNVVRSAAYIDREGIFFKILGFPLFQIDNMTDCMMLNIAVHADSRHPVETAMLNSYGYEEHGSHGYTSMAKDTETMAREGNGSMPDVMMYGRYWHGYQVFLRPLLLVFDYRQIRIVNYVLLFSLAAVLAAMLRRRAGTAVALVFILSLLAVSFPIVPLAMQFSTCFYVAFAASIIVLVRPQTVDGSKRSDTMFFTVGAVTAYLDFLTTPQITLGLPLVCAFMTGNVRGRRCMYVVRTGVMWLLGYSLLWASKWGLAFLLTDSGADVLGTAVGSFLLRTSDDVYFGGEKMPISSFFEIILSKLPAVAVCALWAFAALLVAAVGLWLWRCRRSMNRYGYLLLIAAMVPVWYMLLRNHSLQHIFFTWRAMFVTIFTVMLFAYCNINKKEKAL